ncbi:MAG: TonB-dependent receptor, partial [Janthinobacterium lividum]
SGPIATERGTLSNDLAPVIKVHSDSVSLHGDLDLDFATLASITSYRDERSDIAADLEGSYAVVQEATYHQTFKDFTQEVNLTSAPGTPFSYVVGVFYFHEKSGDSYFNFNGKPFFHGYLTTDAISGYADGTYKFGKLSIIAGLRYSSERKALEYGAGAAVGFPVNTNHTFGDLTPRAGLSYALTSSSNVYATFSKGFKSGTYNLSSGSIVPVRPEKVDAYEIGYKVQSHRLSFNTSAFYYKYDDIQITAFDYTVGISRLLNAAKAEIYGVDGDVTWKVSNNFDLHAAAGYTHARFKSFPGAVIFVPNGGNTGNTTVIQDESGRALLRAPEFTVSATANYRIPLDANQIDLAVTPYYTSKINYSFDERIQQPAYFTLDANLAYVIKGNLRLALYGKNLTDKVYATFRSASSTRDGVTYASPRTYGVSASYKF